MAISVDSIDVGSQMDDYRIEEVISRDQMYSMFRAVDTRSGKQVGLKVPSSLVESDSVFYDRLRREEEIGRRLNHPLILKVHAEDHGSRIYLVTEWCEGKSLKEILLGGKMPQKRAIKLMSALLDALDYIHLNGVYHRALRPECILVDGQDRIKITDFGMAGSAEGRRLTYTNLSASLSAAYVAPEQVKGKRGDARSDLYSAGVIFYEMLTGKLPFPGANPLAIMNARLMNPPVPPTVADSSVSPQLQEVIYRALERDPHQRYASAREFKHDLEHLDELGVYEREEERQWRKKNAPKLRKVLFLLLIVFLPALLFALMFLLK